MIEQKSHLPSEYQEKHKLSSEFSSHSQYLDHELTIMAPRHYRLNLPGRGFRFEIEDLVPAISGTIGKVT